MKKLIFVSGPYRAPTKEQIEININNAREAAIKIWQGGDYALCPHLNSCNFDGLCDDSVWLEGDLEMLRRCDAIYMLQNHANSEGATRELELAQELGLEIYYELQDGLAEPQPPEA